MKLQTAWPDETQHFLRYHAGIVYVRPKDIEIFALTKIQFLIFYIHIPHVVLA